jgi:hypothetical protein
MPTPKHCDACDKVSDDVRFQPGIDRWLCWRCLVDSEGNEPDEEDEEDDEEWWTEDEEVDPGQDGVM